jgi:hypothetical protein
MNTAAVKTLFVGVLLSFFAVFQVPAESEGEFFAHMIDSLPKASRDQFKTPDSVARYFVQEILDNRIQNTFRCMPLSRMYASNTFENSVRRVGNYFDPKMRFPTDEYGRFLRLLIDQHYTPVRSFQVQLLLKVDPSKTNLLEGFQRPPNDDPATVNKWLERLSNDLSSQSFTNVTISSVTSTNTRESEIKYLGVLPFKDSHIVTVNLSIRNSENPVKFLVGVVDGNYQIKSMMEIFPESRP